MIFFPHMNRLNFEPKSFGCFELISLFIIVFKMAQAHKSTHQFDACPLRRDPPVGLERGEHDGCSRRSTLWDHIYADGGVSFFN